MLSQARTRHPGADAASRFSGTAHAQPKADIVRLANGDRITGEVKNLNRGQLELSTDDVGTLYFEWDKIVSLSAVGQFDVTTTDGRRFLGGLAAGDPKTLVIVEVATRVPLPMIEVATINPIGSSFWTKLDGSFDLGFSYTKSSDISTLNVNSNTLYRRPAFEGRLTASATVTTNADDGHKDDRGSIQAFVCALSRPAAVHCVRCRVRQQRKPRAAAALADRRRGGSAPDQQQPGSAVHRRRDRGQRRAERGRRSDEEPGGALHVAAVVLPVRSPENQRRYRFQYYPSLSNWGRQRIQLDASARREVLKDFFLAINMFDTFDSRPPSPDAAKNDVGVSFSIGWSY